MIIYVEKEDTIGCAEQEDFTCLTASLLSSKFEQITLKKKKKFFLPQQQQKKLDLQAKIPREYFKLKYIKTPETLGIQKQALLYKSARSEAWLLGRSFELLTDSAKS